MNLEHFDIALKDYLSGRNIDAADIEHDAGVLEFFSQHDTTIEQYREQTLAAAQVRYNSLPLDEKQVLMKLSELEWQELQHSFSHSGMTDLQLAAIKSEIIDSIKYLM